MRQTQCSAGDIESEVRKRLAMVHVSFSKATDKTTFIPPPTYELGRKAFTMIVSLSFVSASRTEHSVFCTCS